MRGHGSQWISNKINIRHLGQLKKWKSWEPFGSYQLNSTANPAHLPQNWAYFEVNGLDWQCCLAGSSQRAPRILIFSIAMGADYSFYVKTIETHARAFFNVIIFSISSVNTVFSINLPLNEFLVAYINRRLIGPHVSILRQESDCFSTTLWISIPICLF